MPKKKYTSQQFPTIESLPPTSSRSSHAHQAPPTPFTLPAFSPPAGPRGQGRGDLRGDPTSALVRGEVQGIGEGREDLRRERKNWDGYEGMLFWMEDI